jgi:small-conductance mechanosensitive channel
LEEAAQEAVPPGKVEKQIEEPGFQERRRIPPQDKAWLFTGMFLLLGLGAALFMVNWRAAYFRPSTFVILQRYLIGGLAIVTTLGVMRVVEVFLIGRLRNAVSRYNLKRVLRLLTALGVVFVAVSILFVNWYTAVVSLGLISLILGFALQTPISSFVGWVYILARAPYRVGDRIEIGDVRGDVIDVSYLDTTLWEIGGRHLSTDHPSGRIIRFPNSTIFNSPVLNYSWPLFPYVWNEIKFCIAYESDLDFVAQILQKLATQEVGDTMMENVKRFRDLLERTPVDHLEVKERPSVIFRPSENTWIEAIVRYLVDPREAGQVKSRLTRQLVIALNAAPDRVLFPKSNLR